MATGGMVTSGGTSFQRRRNATGSSARARHAATVASDPRSPANHRRTGRSSAVASQIAKALSISTNASATSRMRANCAADMSS